MGGHHGPKLPEIPDWRIYRVEDVPELMKLKKNLACHGLSDPWLRNEVWRYTEFGKKAKLSYFLKTVGLRGFKYGLLAAVLTTGIQFVFSESSNKENDHH